MISFSATVLNGKIRKAFLTPFLNILSPVDPLRLQEQVEMEIQNKKVRESSGKIKVPDRYVIRINSGIYQQNVSRLPVLITQLIWHIHLYTKSEGWFIGRRPVTVEFNYAAYLGKHELEMRGYFSKPENQPTPPLPSVWFIYPIGHPERGRHIDTPGEYVCGRNQEAWFHIDNPYISQNQAVITASSEGKLFVRDNSSKNGTFVNESRIPAAESVSVKKDDCIRFGLEQGITLVVQ